MKGFVCLFYFSLIREIIANEKEEEIRWLVF